MFKRLLTKGLPILACAFALAPVSEAQTPLNYEPGELLMGFHATAGDGAPKCYLVNIGPAADFLSATTPFTVANLGNIKADLDATFPSWQTQGTVFWSVSGTVGSFDPVGEDVAKTLYATKVQAIPGTPNSTRWTRGSSTTQGVVTSKMNSMAAAFEFVNGDSIAGVKNQSTANSPKARLHNTTDVNSYASYQPGGTPANSGTPPGISFAYFNPTIEGTFASGTANSILELYRLAPGSGQGEFIGTFTIDDNANLTFTPFDDPSIAKVSVAQATTSVSEADASGKVTLTLTRSGNTASAISVNVGTADGTAVAGTDYTALSGVAVPFAAGVTSGTADVPVANIAGFQGDRAFTVSITGGSAGSAIKSPSTTTVTILEADSTVSLSSLTYAVGENVAGGNAQILLLRGGNLGSTFTVDFSTADGTALAGTDFTGQTNSQISFAANEAEKTVNVAITNRAGPLGSRAFTVTLSNASAGANIIAPSSATVTIADGGVPGVLAFSAAAYQFTPKDANGAPNILAITIARTGGVDGTVTADLSLAAGGTLATPADFTFTNPTTVTFDQGDAMKTVNIPLTAPGKAGTINLALGNATAGATLGGQTTAAVTVSAVDALAPKLTVDAFPKPITANFNLTGFATDDAGISRVEVKVNGGAAQLATLGAFAAGKATFTLAFAPENGKNTITFQAVDLQGNKSALVTKTLTFINLRPALAGAFNGLLAPAGTPSNATSGFATLKITPTGAFTGKVTLGGFALPISGIIGNDGKAHFKPTLATTFALAGKKPPTALGTLEMTATANEVTGTLKDAGNAVVANLDADRAFFDGKTPATTVPANFLVNKGAYTAVLPSKAQAGSPALTTFPQGDGIGTITVTAKGLLTFKGSLADGSKVVLKGPLSQALQAALYAQLYNKQGSIAGVVTLDDAQADSDVKGTDFLWFNPGAVAAKYYPNGWAGLKVDLLGAKYFAAAGTPVLAGLLPVDAANGNVTLAFADGRLTTNPLNKSINIDPATNKVSNAPVADKTFALKLAATKGTATGTFTHTDNTKGKFGLVIFQKGVNAGGFGYFLSTVPKGLTNGESGGVSLTKK